MKPALLTEDGAPPSRHPCAPACPFMQHNWHTGTQSRGPRSQPDEPRQTNRPQQAPTASMCTPLMDRDFDVLFPQSFVWLGFLRGTLCFVALRNAAPNQIHAPPLSRSYWWGAAWWPVRRCGGAGLRQTPPPPPFVAPTRAGSSKSPSDCTLPSPLMQPETLDGGLSEKDLIRMADKLRKGVKSRSVTESGRRVDMFKGTTRRCTPCCVCCASAPPLGGADAAVVSRACCSRAGWRRGTHGVHNCRCAWGWGGARAGGAASGG
jgi:hypothetical protein